MKDKLLSVECNCGYLFKFNRKSDKVEIAVPCPKCKRSVELEFKIEEAHIDFKIIKDVKDLLCHGGRVSKDRIFYDEEAGMVFTSWWAMNIDLFKKEFPDVYAEMFKERN